MDEPKPVAKTAAIIWAVALGLVFVFGYSAVAVLGTKASSTFSNVSSSIKNSPVPAPPTAGTADPGR